LRALVLTVENKETKHHIQQKHETHTEKPVQANKTNPWIATSFTTTGLEMECALFLQPIACMGPQTNSKTAQLMLTSHAHNSSPLTDAMFTLC